MARSVIASAGMPSARRRGDGLVDAERAVDDRVLAVQAQVDVGRSGHVGRAQGARILLRSHRPFARRSSARAFVVPGAISDELAATVRVDCCWPSLAGCASVPPAPAARADAACARRAGERPRRTSSRRRRPSTCRDSRRRTGWDSATAARRDAAPRRRMRCASPTTATIAWAGRTAWRSAAGNDGDAGAECARSACAAHVCGAHAATAPRDVVAPRMKPSRSRFVTMRGLSYHVRTWGDPGARKLFLLHGWMDVSASFQFLVDALADDWHVLAPDWRGFGLSRDAAGRLLVPRLRGRPRRAGARAGARRGRSTSPGTASARNVALAHAGARPRAASRT